MTKVMGRFISMDEVLGPDFEEVEVLTDDVLAFGWQSDGVAQRLRRRLELDPDHLDASFAHGWSMCC